MLFDWNCKIGLVFKGGDYANLHRSSSEAGVDVLLEVWIFGGQVTEIWGFVFVSIPRMHGFIQSHGEHWGSRGHKDQQ